MKILQLYKRYARFIDACILTYLLPMAIYTPNLIDMRDSAKGAGDSLLPYFSLLFIPFVFNSVYRLCITFDVHLKDLCPESVMRSGFKGRLLYILRQKSFLAKALVIALIYLAVPLKYTLYAVTVLFNIDTFAKKLAVLAVLYPVLFIISALAYSSAIDHWRMEKGEESYKAKAYYKRLIKTCAVYIFAIPFIAALALKRGSVITFLIKEIGLAVLIITLSVILLTWLIKRLRALKIRKEFVKSFTELCRQKGIEATPIVKPYYSAIINIAGESFSFSVNGKKYSCKLLASHSRYRKAYVTQDMVAYLYRLSLRGITLLRYEKYTYFDYESDGRKLLILNPIPKVVMASKNGVAAPLDNGDVIGGYKVYSASGFLRALELDTLER